MVLTGENRSTLAKTCRSSQRIPPGPTWVRHPGFRSEKPATDCLMYETAFLILYLRVWQNANPVVHGASLRLVTH
jgi:hypothetical protein